MHYPIKLSVFRIVALVAAPMVAFPAAISLTVGSSTTCEWQSCSNMSPLAANGSISGDPGINFAVNGDSYLLSAPWSASNSDPKGTSFSASPTVTYTGSGPIGQADVFTIDFWQTYTYNGPLNDYYYHEATSAEVHAALGSSLTAEAFFDSQGIGVMGPFPVGNWSDSKEALLTALTGTPLSFEYQFVFDFAAGSEPGSYISAATIPEPATSSLALFGTGLLLFSVYKRRVRTARV